MKGYQAKLFSTFTLLILVVFVGLGIVFSQVIKMNYVHFLDERLMNESRLFVEYIQDHGGISKVDKQKLINLNKTLDSRIVILDKDENIVFDSDKQQMDSETLKSFRQLLNEKSKSANGEIIEDSEGNNLHFFWNLIEKNGKKDGYLIFTTQLPILDAAYSQIWKTLLISFAIALIIIMIITHQLTYQLTKPIGEAAKVASELARGNYRARTNNQSTGEIGKLNTSINLLAKNLEMMEKMQEMQQDRLIALIKNMASGLLFIDSRGHIILINDTYKEIFNVKEEDYLKNLYYKVIDHREVVNLIEDIFITEQKIKKRLVLTLGIERRYFEVYGAPILSANDVWKGVVLVFHDITEIINLEKVRKDFVANVSHELKTPITSIKGFAETLLDGALNDKNALEQFLSIIYQESIRMQALIQDLLELSKIEDDSFTLNVEKFQINELLEEVILILQGKAEEKHIQLHFDPPPYPMHIEGDPYRLKQVFINLITNGISYTPEGGKVTVSLEEREHTICVNVKDTGIGIEKDQIPRIFERFYRVDKARSRNSGGTGLGLAIVKHIVEAHKGRISVESELGTGSIFSIELQKSII